MSASVSGSSIIIVSEIFLGLGLKKGSAPSVGPSDSSMLSRTSPRLCQDHIPSWYFSKVLPFSSSGNVSESSHNPLVIPAIDSNVGFVHPLNTMVSGG